MKWFHLSIRYLSDEPFAWRHRQYLIHHWLSQCRKQPYRMKRRRNLMKKNNQWKSCIRHHSRSCGTKNWVLADSARVGWLAHSSGYPRATAPSLVFFNLSLPPLHCARCVFSPRVRHLFFSPFTAALGRHCSTGDGTRSIWLLLWLLRSILQRWNVFSRGC